MKLQQAVRTFLSWRRLHKLATLRPNLTAAVQGYRVRRFMRLISTKALVREIQLMLRRETRQTSQYLKDQQRKKTRVLIVQLISQGKAYPQKWSKQGSQASSLFKKGPAIDQRLKDDVLQVKATAAGVFNDS